jgi:hypothetical protein
VKRDIGAEDPTRRRKKKNKRWRWRRRRRRGGGATGQGLPSFPSATIALKRKNCSCCCEELSALALYSSVVSSERNHTG